MKHKTVLVPFPFDDFTGIKVRPALCLTNKIGAYQHVVIAFITSQIGKATEPSNIPLLDTDTHFQITGLKVSSAIRLHRLVTVPTQIIKRQLGILPSDYHQNIEQQIRDLFEL